MSIERKIKQAVILAGGLGTRLIPLTKEIPKPMISFHKKPFIAYLLDRLKEQGIQKVLLLVGYQSNIIKNYFGDGSDLGIEITYSDTPIEDNTGTRVRKAFDQIEDQFILMYCDNYWPFDMDKLETSFFQRNVDAQVVIYNNDDLYTKNNVIIEDGLVKVYDKKRETEGLHGVDIGFILINKLALYGMPKEDFSIETFLFSKLIKQGKLGGFLTGHRYYSVGSFERIELTRKFFSKEKYVLIDRDGVLNKRAPKSDYIKSWQEWEWLEGAKEGLKYLSEKGYKLILITNQAGIARKKMSESDLHAIHFLMKEDLAELGVQLEQIYYCPHGWDDNCSCRKPRPGMLWNAQRDFSFDLSKTYFIGDDPRDMEAASSAGAIGLFKDEHTSLLSLVKKHF